MTLSQVFRRKIKPQHVVQGAMVGDFIDLFCRDNKRVIKILKVRKIFDINGWENHRSYLGPSLQSRFPVLLSERAAVWPHLAWECSGDPHRSGPCERRMQPLSRERRPCSSHSRAPSALACSPMALPDSRSSSVACRGNSGWVQVPPRGTTSPQPAQPKLPQTSGFCRIQAFLSLQIIIFVIFVAPVS